MVDLISGDGRDDGVEVLEGGHVVVGVSEALVVDHHFAHEVICILTLLLHQVHCGVKHLDSLQSLTSDSQVICDRLESKGVQERGQVLKQVLVVLEGSILDHSHEAKGVSDLGDALSDGLKVVFTLGEASQVLSQLHG